MISNQKKIQHLYLRAGFGLSPKKLSQKQNINPKTEAQKLVKKAKEKSSLTPVKAPFESWNSFANRTDMEKAEARKNSKKKLKEVNNEWVHRMATTDNPLLERMTLFWHDHFACRILFAHFAVPYLNSIRQHALGNFKDLVLAISKDAAMIRYLNNQQNKKTSPNENYARELLELFTIGRGNYTEQDIKEAARAFTGWSSDFKGNFVFRKYWHDFDEKTFMGRTGNFDGEDIIDIILSNKATARFIVTKVYKYFVNENINGSHIEYLTNEFYNSNYDIGHLMMTVFTSDAFFEPKNMGTKIKSPIDLVVGIMKTYQVTFEDSNMVVFLQKALGQQLFNPPNVAGWAGGKLWIDNATLMLRLNLVNYLFENADMNLTVKAEFEDLQPNKRWQRLKVTANPQALVNTFKSYSEFELFTQLANYLLQPSVKLNPDLFKPYIIQDNKSDMVKTLTLRMMSMPEYQLC